MPVGYSFQKRETTIAMKVFAMCVLGAVAVTGLNNGLGRTPPMGYSSWNDCASEASDCPCKYKKKSVYYFLKNIHSLKKITCK